MIINPNIAASARNRRQIAFTLMEVMIAMGIFFMSVFAILALVSSNLHNARMLQEPTVDASMILADICQTNKLTAGSASGDFGDLYPGYRWRTETIPAYTNGFFQVDVYIITPKGDEELNMSRYFWDPFSDPQGPFK